MRVAYVLPSLSSVGGWRSHAKGFVDEISAYVEPLLFFAQEDRQVVEREFSRWNRIALPATQGVAVRLANMSQVCRTFGAVMFGRYPKVDLVQSLEAYPTGMIGHWLANRLCKPHVITVHGTYGVMPKRRKLDRLLYSRVLKDAAVVCPVSTGTGRLMGRYFSRALSGSLMRPILNGNDFYKTVSREQVNRRRPSPQPTILTVGAVKPRKGHHVALQAFARVKRVLPNARYRIVGSPPSQRYEAELRRIMDRLQIGDVKFLGSISQAELRRRYEEASVFLLPAQQVGLRFEGFGLVYIEAGAFGVPVVGTRSGGVADAIKDGETGFVVDPDNIEDLANALLRILTDQGLAKRMGSAGRTWAETLTWNRYAREQHMVYKEVLEASQHRRAVDQTTGSKVT